MLLEIGMKKDKLRKLAEEILAQDGDRVEVEVYANLNDASMREIKIQISNEDMERDDVGADQVYVDYSAG